LKQKKSLKLVTRGTFRPKKASMRHQVFSTFAALQLCFLLCWFITIER
jgi:hypothetical protein